MEATTLVSVLQATTSPDSTLRKQAEAELIKYELLPGQSLKLLEATMHEALDVSVRLAAAINFKNLVKRYWEPRETGKPRLSDADKGSIRANIVETIIRSPKQMQVQMGEVLHMIIYADYPERFPELLQQIVAALSSNDRQCMHGALLSLRIMARKYEFKDEVERFPLHAIVGSTFPLLLPLLQTLLADTSGSPDVPLFIKLILKAFWSASYMTVPDILAQPGPFEGWMGSIHTCLVLPLPYDRMPHDLDDRKKWAWFKMRKWAINLAHRLMSRYGDVNACKPGVEATFAAMFDAKAHLPLVEANTQLLSQVFQGQYLPPRCTNLALQCVTSVLSNAKVYGHIQPHMHALVHHIVFPMLCFDDEDERLWREDPHEYIRKGYDILEDMYSPKTAAMNFLHDLATKRPAGNLDPFMASLNAHIQEFAAAAPSADTALSRRMDGALLALGTLKDVLTRKKKYRAHLETLLITHVLPLFESPRGHLRSKACWVVGLYADIKWAEGKGQGANFQGMMGKVVERLQDPDLPVRVDAVVALRAFVEVMAQPDILKPILPTLLQQFFSLINEVENEDLVFTLEAIVEKIGDDIGPYAEQLCLNLARAFDKCTDAEDDDEQGALAAYGCLRALNTLLGTVADSRPLMARLEEILYPTMQKMLCTDGQDVMEEILEMVAYFTYFTEDISPRMWSLWPLMHACIVGWAIDYLDHFVVPMDNYISKGSALFISSTAPDYKQSMFEICEKALIGDFNDTDVIPAARLMDVAMQVCKGHLDSYVPHYLNLACSRLQTAKSMRLKVALLCCVANALYYNAALSLGVLQQAGTLERVMSLWFQLLFESNDKGGMKHFRRQQDKKVCILGMASILPLAGEAVPTAVSGGWAQIMVGLLKVLVSLKEQMEAEEAAEEEDETKGEDEDDEDGDIEDVDIDDEALEVLDPNDAEYVAKLSKSAFKMFGLGEGSDDDGDHNGFSDDEDVGTVLDPIDPFVFLADALAYVDAHVPARMTALTAACDANAQQALQGMMAYAAAQRAETAQPEHTGPQQ